MIYEVPLSAIPSQEVSVILANQDVTVRVYTRGDYLYLDVLNSNLPVIQGQIIVNATNLLPGGLVNFVGNFQMIDIDGGSDPVYTGLGEKYLLLYSDET